MEKVLAVTSILVASMMLINTTVASPTKLLSKVFTYQGSLPIKDDLTGAIIHEENNDTATSTSLNETAVAEAACWDLVNEQSGNYGDIV